MPVIISLIPIVLLGNSTIPIVDGNYIILTGGPIPIHTSKTETQAECLTGQKVLIVYKNIWSPQKTSTTSRDSWSGGQRSIVEKIAIDGRDVPGAVEALKAKVSNRGIDWISILNCGSDNKNPEISGIMKLSGSQLKEDRRNSTVYFQFNKRKILKLN